jgi:hypothetical protein
VILVLACDPLVGVHEKILRKVPSGLGALWHEAPWDGKDSRGRP